MRITAEPSDQPDLILYFLDIQLPKYSPSSGVQSDLLGSFHITPPECHGWLLFKYVYEQGLALRTFDTSSLDTNLASRPSASPNHSDTSSIPRYFWEKLDGPTREEWHTLSKDLQLAHQHLSGSVESQMAFTEKRRCCFQQIHAKWVNIQQLKILKRSRDAWLFLQNSLAPMELDEH
ncbi:hypothetical protein CPB86DRAFT_452665 [Serendipita vermifera]|nr:hypothetical protein CPB86DRAFT_452665 [Serendipita vermifera]